jgi:hypothetical protein
VTLNETQFHLFDPKPFTQAAPRGAPSERSRAVNRLTSVAIERFPNEPPAGMRGSVPEREALALRYQKQRDGRERWQSMTRRYQDQVWWDDKSDAPGPPHPTTGLPSYGPLKTDEHLGMEVLKTGDLPRGVSFHQSERSARIKNSTIEEVPLWNNVTQQHIATVQGDVSSQRVHEILDNPSTASSQRVPRPHPELPHVYSGQGFGGGDQPFVRDDVVVDGNHRTASHILQGQLFMQSHVIRDRDLPGLRADSKRIKGAKRRAEINVSDRGHAALVDERTVRNYHGQVRL